ncbi:hypothetical protein CIK58_05210 [Brevibacterium aurantiacum]|nr:hypothetical protein CIK58_05210 [Brevibacterium aurantiacum]RCS90722.1 DedA family protein [Brevibacterium aurantiacum]
MPYTVAQRIDRSPFFRFSASSLRGAVPQVCTAPRSGCGRASIASVDMDLALDILRTTVESPWVYLLVFVIAGMDSLFPIVPSETVLITAAAYAAAGIPSPLGLLLAAVVGALIGDFAAHLVGRGGGSLVQRWTRSSRAKRLLAHTEEIFARRGGVVLIAGRFIPGGRSATTLSSGILKYPRTRFLIFDALGCLAWAIYSIGVGLLGGVLFEDQPLLGVGLGIGIALAITGVAELTRRLLARRKARADQDPAAHRDPADWTAAAVDVA